MKFLFIIYFTLINLSFSFAWHNVHYKTDNEKDYAKVPEGVNVTTVSLKDSIIKTDFDGNNIEKEVIIEFISPPVKINSGEVSFNASENSNRIEILNIEHRRFLEDLENIIGSRTQMNNPDLDDTDYKITAEYRIALNGFAISTKQWVIEEIEKLDYVKKVHNVIEVNGTDDISNHVIGADSVWSELGITGEGILISIIDTGIDSNHVSLNNAKVVGGYNFAYNSGDFYDDHGHGTHCAGIAAGNGGGLTGVAPDAKLLAVKVLSSANSGSSSGVISGIEYSLDPDGDPNTDDGADILSLSLGGQGNPDDALSTAVDNAVANGAVVVAAAGNNGEFYSIDSPGCARDAITVGASNNDDEMAYFSSRGPVETTFDIKPDITAPGVSIYSAKPENLFTYMSGTSMATPHVAGAAALLKELHPDWTPNQIKSSIVCNAIDINAAIWEQGNGRLDIYKAAISETILSPGLINFGLVDMNADIWTSTDTLTLYNKSDSEQTYNILSEYDLPEGFNCSVEPDAITIEAHSDSIVVVTITIDNSVFPVKDSEPPVYSGRIFAESNTDTVSSSFSFVKSRILNISFDEAPSYIIIIDSDDNVINYSYLNNLKLLVPKDTFDIIAYYSRYGEDNYIHVVESVKINSDTICNINIEKHNAGNNLNFKYYDTNYKQFNASAGGWFIFNMRGVWAISSFGVIRDNYFFSDFSENYNVELLSITYPENDYESINKYVAFYSTIGIDSSDSLNISPQSSVLINHQLHNSFDCDTIYYDDYISNSRAHAHYSNFHSELTYPYNYKTYYYNYNGNENNLWLTSHFFSDSDLMLSDLDNKIIMGPFVNMSNGKLNFLQQNQSDTLHLFAIDSNSVNTSVYHSFKGKVLIERNTLKLFSPPTIDYFKRNLQGLFHSDYGYTYNGNVNLKFWENDILQDEQSLNNLRKKHNSIFTNNYLQRTNLSQNNYKIELIYDSSYVYTKYGFAKATIGFTNTGSKDSLPAIVSLNASKNGLINDFFMLDDSINVNLHLKGIQVGDSVQIFYRIFGEENWAELELNESIDRYTAPINNLDSICYYSLKVDIKRDSNNYVIHELEPAFACGISIPELISPEIESYQELLGKFEWNTVDNAQNYTLQISQDEAFNDIMIEVITNDTTYTLMQPLNYNKQYFWRVKANTNDITGIWSDIWQFYSPSERNPERYELYSWGNNNNGQLGLGNSESKNTPIKISGVDWNSISAGYNYSLTLKNDGTIWVWGYNDEGQLGNSNFDEIHSPEKAANSNYWKNIDAGQTLSLAIRNNGTLWAWGDNTEGFLGHFNYDYRNSPEQISNDNDWKKIVAGGKQFFAIKEDGTLWAWGRNDWGELGLGSVYSKQTPFQIGQDDNWNNVKTGLFHTIALKQDGTIWGCGYNISGQLGDDEQTIRKTFMQIGYESNWKAISSGAYHILTLKNDGTLWACGANNHGQLGDGTTIQRSTLTQIGTDDDWLSIAAGSNHSLALKENGTLWAWGSNSYGQLGDSSNMFKTFPVQISEDTNWVYIDARQYQSFAMKKLPFEMEMPVLIEPLKHRQYVSLNPEFKWYGIENSTEYLLQVSKDEDFENLIISETINDTTYQVIQSLENNTQFYWRVKAYNFDNESLFSEVWNFTASIPIPETPTLVSPDNGSDDIMPYINLKWSNCDYADSYDLQVSSESDFSAVEFEINTNNIQRQITHLNLGMDYHWRVRAVNISGTSEWSDIYSFSVTDNVEGNILYISLQPGWNYISSNIEAENMNMENIFENLKDDICIVKNISDIFIPKYQLNTINNWSVSRGYKVFSVSDNTVVMHGNVIEPDEIEITLDAGWNVLPYLKSSEMLIADALDAISDKIVIVLDDERNIWIPDFINSIGNMTTGKAFLIYMNESVSFYYPAN